MFHCSSNVHILYLNNFLFQFFIFFICSTKVLNLYDFFVVWHLSIGNDVDFKYQYPIHMCICPSHPIHPLLSWRYRRPQSSHNWNQRFTDVSFRCSVSYRTHSIVSPFPFPFPSSLSFSDVVLVWLLVVLVCPIGTLVVVVVDIVEMYIVKVFYVWAGPCSYHSSGVQDMTTFEKNWLLADALAKRWTRKCLFKTTPIQIQYYKFQ